MDTWRPRERLRRGSCTGSRETVNRAWIGSTEVGQSAIILLKEVPTFRVPSPDVGGQRSSEIVKQRSKVVGVVLETIRPDDRFTSSIVLCRNCNENEVPCNVPNKSIRSSFEEIHGIERNKWEKRRRSDRSLSSVIYFSRSPFARTIRDIVRKTVLETKKKNKRNDRVGVAKYVRVVRRSTLKTDGISKDSRGFESIARPTTRLEYRKSRSSSSSSWCAQQVTGST